MLYYIGPINWASRESAGPLLFVGICLIAFNLGSMVRYRPPSRLPPFPLPVPKSRRVAYLIVGAYFALSIIYLGDLTGKDPLAIGSYSTQFGQVYREFGEQLRARNQSAFMVVITILQAALFPFVLMIFFDRFKTDKPLVALIIAIKISSSFLRGTDKELVDAMLMIGGAVFFHGLLTRRILYLLPLAPIIFYLFLLRRLGRFSDALPICLPNSVACFDYDSLLARIFGNNAEILAVFLTNYISQGYEGLARALPLAFDFNYMVGHLPPIKRSLCQIADWGCSVPTYEEKLLSTGWNTANNWTTAYPIIANDFSFYGAPIFMFVLGLLFSASSMAWKLHRDIPSVTSLFMLAYFFLYSSANMQIAISLEWAFCTLLFVYWNCVRLRLPSNKR